MKNTLQTINDLALNNPKELVSRAERHYEGELTEIAARIADNKDIKIVALAGPSASGKTTTAHILCEKLRNLGEKIEIISLDDFYFLFWFLFFSFRHNNAPSMFDSLFFHCLS